MHRHADGELVGRAPGSSFEHRARRQVDARTAEVVVGEPGAPLLGGVLDTSDVRQPGLPRIAVHDPTAADESEVGPVLRGVADVGELPVDGRQPALGVEQRIAGPGVAVHDDGRPGRNQMALQPVGTQLHQRQLGCVAAVHPAPALDVVGHHLLRRAARRIQHRDGHAVQLCDRADDVVETRIVEAHHAGNLLHDEEGLAQDGTRGLDALDLGHGVPGTVQGAHRRDLGLGVGAEHAALLDPDDDPALDARLPQRHPPHPPREPTADHGGGHDLDRAARVRRQPVAQPAPIICIDLDDRVLDAGVMTGEGAHERRRRHHVCVEPLAQLGHGDVTDREPQATPRPGIRTASVDVLGDRSPLRRGAKRRIGQTGPDGLADDVVGDERLHQRARSSRATASSRAKSYPAPHMGSESWSGASTRSVLQNHS